MSDPVVRRTMTRTVIGVEVSDLTVELFGDADTEVLNVPLAEFARKGGFDGAEMLVERHYAAAWEAEACGSLHVFLGDVAEVSISSSRVSLSVKSKIQRLNIQLPRNMYQAPCVHTVYDAGCALSASSFAVGANVGIGSTTVVIATDLAQASGYFDLGTVTFLDGPCEGITASVRSYDATAGSLTLAQPLAVAPIDGNAISVKPGCDKTKATCVAKFDNVINFRGFPYVPVPEAST